MNWYPKFNVLFIISATVLICACSDIGSDTVQTEQTKEPNKVLMLPDYSAIHNPLNPHNDYGVLHNAGLDYILDYHSVSTFEELTYEQIRYAGARFTVEISELLDFSDIPTMEGYIDDAMEATLEDVYQNSTLSIEQIDFCNQIRDGVLTAEFSSLDEFMQMLEAIEQDILDSSMPAHQKECPLMVVAVAKHSAVYHAPYIGIPESSAKQGSDVILEMDQHKKQKRFAQAVEADLMGAIKGAVGGFFSGLVYGAVAGTVLSGGVAGIPGAAGGAILGSAGGAIGSAVVSSADYIMKPG